MGSASKVPQKNVAPFEETLSFVGFGKFQLLVLLIAGGCLMCVIIETMGMMFVAPAAQCDLNLGLTERGILNAISFLGTITCSHMWGFIADTKGRRKVLVYSMAMSFITSSASSLSPNAWLFILLRFVNGVVVGGSSAVVYAYAGEFNDNSSRPKVVSWMATFVALGNMFLPTLAWLILPQEWAFALPILEISFRPWRLLVFCYSLPSLFFAICMYFLPESPKFLLLEGKQADTLDVLKRMYAFNTGKPASEFPITKILWDEVYSNTEAKKYGFWKTLWKQTSPLFKMPLRAKTAMVCILQFGAFASFSGIYMWMPEMLNKIVSFADQNPNGRIYLCDSILDQAPITIGNNFTEEAVYCTDTIETSVFQTSLLIGTACATVYLLIGSLINILGKKNILLIFFITSTIAGIVAQHIDGPIIIQGLLGVVLLSSTSIGVINAIVVDIYPTHLRAMALAISLMFGRLGAVTGSHLIGPIFYNLCSYVFYIVGASQFVLITVVVLLPTKAQPKMVEPIT